jgi:putative restriction endonuclease
MKAPDWDNWLERLYNLRRDKRGAYERPHKPVLLLSIIYLLDRGVIKTNAVPLSDDLVKTFRRYFKVVAHNNDQPSIQNPYYFLSGDGFWRLVPKAGQPPLYTRGRVSRAPSVAELRRSVAQGEFEEGLWELLSDPISRHQLREALISRYFPCERDRIAAVAAATPPRAEWDTLHEELPPERGAAFRRTVLEIYDYRCAACGIRVLLDHSLSLVEAAHLIPFSESRNDMPSNGLALCPNHHWAMDRHLIAPCPDKRRRAGIWRVNVKRLDDRIEGQRDLVALADKEVIPPAERKYYPAEDGLRWRQEHLVAAY